MSSVNTACPHCGSNSLLNNGRYKKTGKQKYYCKGCGKYGTLHAAPRYSEAQKAEILNAYYQKTSLRSIERIFGVTRQTVSGWLK